MNDKSDDADGATKGLADQRSDNPRLWNPWSFWKKSLEWHQLFYDGLASSPSHRAVKHVISNPDEVSPMDDGY